MRNATRLVSGLLILASLGLFGCGGDVSPGGNEPGDGSATADGVVQSVTLVIEFSDASSRRFEAIPWSDGMTVQSLLDAAVDGDGPLSYRFTGRGETAILQSIEGVANEGAGRSANNWLYWVNGQFATRGFGVAEVEPGDTVTWRFAPYDLAE